MRPAPVCDYCGTPFQGGDQSPLTYKWRELTIEVKVVNDAHRTQGVTKDICHNCLAEAVADGEPHINMSQSCAEKYVWRQQKDGSNEPNEREETDEEFLARLAVLRAKRKAAKLAAEEAAKPKLEVVVTPKLAEAVKANPGSLRLSTKAVDETVLIGERARVTEVIEPLDVDGQACVARARRFDCETGEVSIVEYRNGYRLPPGAVSDYHPLDGLRRAEDE
jgi:hypothetical protein